MNQVEWKIMGSGASSCREVDSAHFEMHSHSFKNMSVAKNQISRLNPAHRSTGVIPAVTFYKPLHYTCEEGVGQALPYTCTQISPEKAGNFPKDTEKGRTQR